MTVRKGSINQEWPAGLDPEKLVKNVPVESVRPRHTHYFKSVVGLGEIDVYRVLKLFEVKDPAIQHAIKKLLVAGGRGAGKDIGQDVQESIDTLERWKEMQAEDRVRASNT